ncbi:uncharacterized protein LOC129898779 [Solanum dulcamara]|uniref:uncharacterized protein LOC129898779 n=1 Tax=Solanum dulcamara TaxID=45834 RepID=UPI00248556BC|nr:uncharacterized protein LOC129898779 [Solanum dulcamara]XP_055829429.1 uncharacterized protein LOC129898779 [Solanum dulcamara]XP_055829430.1 uncharacterized protein LOC129898779 [Solanum dulcamara]XP_055829431.1 uncharacterized protein LOC129898779 [Solanum dulcamara]
MQREFVVDGQVYNYHHFIYCVNCEARIARIEDYIPNVHDILYGGYFKTLKDVVVIDQPIFHLLEDGNNLTTANTYCLQCNSLIGWKLIAATRQPDYFIEGRFFMKIGVLMFQNRVTLRSYILGSAYRYGLIQLSGANAQVGGANAQVIGGANAQVGGVNAQVGGTNAQVIGGANAQVGGVNAQVGGANDQALLYLNEEEVGGANADQDGGANEQGPNDQDGAPPMK